MSTEQEHFFYEMYNKLEEHKHALKAFGALLDSSNLWEFSDENLASLCCYHEDQKDGFKISSHSSSLRFGLEQIVAMWIEKFERIMGMYHIYNIIKAEKIANRIDLQITGEDRIEQLRDCINGLNNIIYSKEFSEKTLKKAKEARQICAEHAEKLLLKSEKEVQEA